MTHSVCSDLITAIRRGSALLLAGLLVGCAAPSAAAPDRCPALFAGGRAPVAGRPVLQREKAVLCFEGYAVLDSALTRTPLWAAEHLTRAGLAHAYARQAIRDEHFHAEPRLGPEARSELQDYAHSGFDRGHLAPSGDMPSRGADHESFSLANIVPQAPLLNRRQWSALESSVRGLVERYGEAFVVTGPYFAGARAEALHGRVLVPTHLWKAIYVPGRGAAAYIATNRDRPEWSTMSLDQLRALTGFDVFPGVDAADHTRSAMLGVSWEYRRGRRGWRD